MFLIWKIYSITLQSADDDFDFAVKVHVFSSKFYRNHTSFANKSIILIDTNHSSNKFLLHEIQYFEVWHKLNLGKLTVL